MRISAKRVVSLIIAGFMSGSLGAANLPSGVGFETSGVLKVDGLRFNLTRLTPGYAKKNLVAGRVNVKRENGVVRAMTSFDGGQVTMELMPESNNSFICNTRVEFSRPTESKALMLEAKIPESCQINVPGKISGLSQYNPKKKILLWTSCKAVSIALSDGRTLEVTGDFVAKITDLRDNGGTFVELRLYFSPSKGALTKSVLKLKLTIKTPDTSSVDLKKVVNTGFRDAKAGDGVGGWTDQGPGNDLHCLKSGKLRVGYVDFDIIDQDKNNGNSVIAIGGGRKAGEVEIPMTIKGQYLGLLHATAWTKPGKAGEIEVLYKNGETQLINIESGRDVGNWWNPINLENGYVAWSGATDKSRVGLYFSQFPLKHNDPVTITLRGNNSQLWFIPALSIFDKKINTNELIKEYVTGVGKDWIVLKSAMDMIPGSPLDFSNRLDAPAGKYGRVIINSNGHYTFERQSNKTVRFVGTNLCFTAQYLDKKDADALADRLAKVGYNAVRIHHHDKYLIDRKAPNSLSFDKNNLDKLDYLIYALKKRGIYIATDIYVNRVIKPGDNIPEFVPNANGQVKSLLPISPKMRENWKTFARKWLTHRNPYTGMSLIDDPVLYAVNLTNENNIYQWWRKYPAIASRYLKLFKAWQLKHNPAKKVVTYKQDKRLFIQFLYDLQEKYTMELYNYLKGELKVKALVSDLNMHDKIPLALIRDRLDIVDSHKYHDHPKFPGRPFKYPFSFRQQSAIAGLGYQVPGILFGARIFGKPFGVTEYRYCPPNRYRVEGGSLIGAYAALQDWDALYQFAWEHSSKRVVKDSPMGSLNSAHDPLTQLSDRLVMLLFRRKDVAAAANGAGLKVDRNFWNSSEPIDCPVKFSQLGLITRIGLVVGNKKVPGVELISEKQAEAVKPLLDQDIENKRKEMLSTGIARSTSGELFLDSKAVVFKVNTPRSAVVTAMKGSFRGGPLQVTGINTPTTVAACSLDDLKLAASNKILLLHLTDVCDSDIRFQSGAQRLMLSPGKLPHLLRRATVKIKLAYPGNGPVSVYALKSNGGTYGRIESRRIPGFIEFTADNSRYPGGVMAYFIEK